VTTWIAAAGEAAELEQSCPVGSYREAFHVPSAPSGVGGEAAYLAGNSLGLQPRSTRETVLAELDRWAEEAVRGWDSGPSGWLAQDDSALSAMARVVGADPDEIAVTGTLTVDLHLLMAGFYQPVSGRDRIVIEDRSFPSDSHAVQSHVAWHGLDPERVVVRLAPRPGEDCLRTADVLDFLGREGDSVAMLLFGGVNYLTGELMDIPAITAAGHQAGAVVCWDLAHAAGNVELALHDWDVDVAAWCTYKYLNSGPGATAAMFVHRRHHGSQRPRLAGWWGTAPADRFDMAPTFVPAAGAAGWAVSTTPVLSSAPVRTAVALHDEVGMPALRERSQRLTAYLDRLLHALEATAPIEVITPSEPVHRGAQLSVRLLPEAPLDAEGVTDALWQRHGVVGDARRPDIVRLAPAPLYSTFEDCRRAANGLEAELARR